MIRAKASSGFAGATLLLGLILGSTPASVRAQAWLPEQGTLSVSAAFNNSLSKYHYLPDGSQADVGHTRTHSVGFAVSYALSDLWLLTAGIPFVRARYVGHAPHPTGVDDGRFHGTFTDLRASLHFQLAERPLALAPFVALVIPTHNYETMGHAAPGRGVQEAWLGFFAGKSLHEWIPKTYVQARYAYAFVEKVAGISHDRSNVDLEIGYFFTPQWSIRALANWQETHGGIAVPIPRDHPLFLYHDQLAAESYLNLGGGVARRLSQRTELYGGYLRSIRGRNGHKLDHGIFLGFGYSTVVR